MKDAHPLPFEEFLRRAHALHGDRYDYSLAQEGWRNTHGKVTLICPEHGRFEQVAGNHLQGHGCPRCGQLRAGHALRLDPAEVTRRVQERFPQYRLAPDTYRAAWAPADWWCTRHRWGFKASFSTLMSVVDGGCPRCIREAKRERRRAGRHDPDSEAHLRSIEASFGAAAANLYRDWLAGDTLAELGRDRGTSGEAARQRLARIRELLDREP